MILQIVPRCPQEYLTCQYSSWCVSLDNLTPALWLNSTQLRAPTRVLLNVTSYLHLVLSPSLTGQSLLVLNLRYMYIPILSTFHKLALVIYDTICVSTHLTSQGFSLSVPLVTRISNLSL